MKIKERIRAAKYAEKIANLTKNKRRLLKIADDFEMIGMRLRFADAMANGCADKEMESGVSVQKEINDLAWSMAESILSK